MQFDINIAVQKQKSLQLDKINGIPDNDVYYQEPVLHVSESDIEQQAEREGDAIKHRFNTLTTKTLKRLYKVDGDKFPTGQFHRAMCRNY